VISLLTVEAQSILDNLYNAVVAWDREPPFKSSVIVATIPEARRYHAASRSIVLVPFEVLPPPPPCCYGPLCNDRYAGPKRARTMH